MAANSRFFVQNWVRQTLLEGFSPAYIAALASVRLPEPIAMPSTVFQTYHYPIFSDNHRDLVGRSNEEAYRWTRVKPQDGPLAKVSLKTHNNGLIDFYTGLKEDVSKDDYQLPFAEANFQQQPIFHSYLEVETQEFLSDVDFINKSQDEDFYRILIGHWLMMPDEIVRRELPTLADLEQCYLEIEQTKAGSDKLLSACHDLSDKIDNYFDLRDRNCAPFAELLKTDDFLEKHFQAETFVYRNIDIARKYHRELSIFKIFNSIDCFWHCDQADYLPMRNAILDIKQSKSLEEIDLQSIINNLAYQNKNENRQRYCEQAFERMKEYIPVWNFVIDTYINQSGELEKLRLFANYTGGYERHPYFNAYNNFTYQLSQVLQHQIEASFQHQVDVKVLGEQLDSLLNDFLANTNPEKFDAARKEEFKNAFALYATALKNKYVAQSQDETLPEVRRRLNILLEQNIISREMVDSFEDHIQEFEAYMQGQDFEHYRLDPRLRYIKSEASSQKPRAEEVSNLKIMAHKPNDSWDMTQIYPSQYLKNIARYKGEISMWPDKVPTCLLYFVNNDQRTPIAEVYWARHRDKVTGPEKEYFQGIVSCYISARFGVGQKLMTAAQQLGFQTCTHIDFEDDARVTLLLTTNCIEHKEYKKLLKMVAMLDDLCNLPQQTKQDMLDFIGPEKSLHDRFYQLPEKRLKPAPAAVCSSRSTLAFGGCYLLTRLDNDLLASVFWDKVKDRIYIDDKARAEAKVESEFPEELIAVVNGDVARLKQLYQGKKIPQTIKAGDNNYRLLMSAGTPECVEYLLQQRLDPKEFNTAMIRAIIDKNEALLFRLLMYFNFFQSYKGMSALEYAIREASKPYTDVNEEAAALRCLEMILSKYQDYVPAGPYDIDFAKFINKEMPFLENSIDELLQQKDSPYLYAITEKNKKSKVEKILEKHNERIERRSQNLLAKPKLLSISAEQEQVGDMSIPVIDAQYSITKDNNEQLHARTKPLSALTDNEKADIARLFNYNFKIHKANTSLTEEEYLADALSSETHPNGYVTLYKNEAGELLSFYTFEVLHGQHAELGGKFVLNHGMLAGNNPHDKRYQKLSLINLTIVVMPLVLEQLHKDKAVLTFMKSIAPGYAISFFGLDANMFPKYKDYSEEFMSYIMEELIQDKYDSSSEGITIPSKLDVKTMPTNNKTFNLQCFKHYVGDTNDSGLCMIVRHDQITPTEYQILEDNDIGRDQIKEFSKLWSKAYPSDIQTDVSKQFTKESSPLVFFAAVDTRSLKNDFLIRFNQYRSEQNLSAGKLPDFQNMELDDIIKAVTARAGINPLCKHALIILQDLGAINAEAGAASTPHCH